MAPALLALVLTLAAQLGTASAHGSAPSDAPGAGVSATARADAEQLTIELANLNTQYHVAPPGQRAALESRLLQIATRREQALAAMLETDPAEFLRVAVPSFIRATLPAAVQAHTEEEMDIEGTLEVLHEDSTTGDRYLHNLETPLGKLTLKFAAEPLTLLSGSKIRAHGTRLGVTLALASGTTSTQTLVAALPNTLGAQKTLVILVNFQDLLTQPMTVAEAKSVVFTTTSDWDRENSYGQTWLTGDVVGWYTIPLSSTGCDYGKISTYAKQAASAHGVNVSNYPRLVFAFPKNACTWWGLGTIGGIPSEAWVNGKFALGAVAHEMGHNFGLYHSHSWDCGTAVLGGTCTLSDYGDSFDMMGKSLSNHVNAFQKERLGWLGTGSSPGITTVTTGGTYTINPYETPGGVKALKIMQNSASDTHYYLEYRQPIGFDASVYKYPNVVGGVIAHTGSPSNANSSYLLDMTPATSSWWDPALVTGTSYRDDAAQVTITPVWANGTNAGVNVAFGAAVTAVCTKAAPTIAVSPAKSQWVNPGTMVTFTVTVTNHDAAGCAASTFTTTGTVPSGWMVTYGGTPVAIAPGASATSTVRVTSPLSAVAGFHTIGLKATDTTARVASTSATYVVTGPLSVSLTTDQATYVKGAQAKITTTVRINGAAVAGANVTVTVTRPGGASTTQSAVSGSLGNAVVTYQINSTYPAGTYTVVSHASVSGGAATGQSSRTFTVSP